MKIKTATDQYGRRVRIYSINKNMVHTDQGWYHVTKLFRYGKALKPTKKLTRYKRTNWRK